jgi:hypothetical protein
MTWNFAALACDDEHQSSCCVFLADELLLLFQVNNIHAAHATLPRSRSKGSKKKAV